MRPALVPQSPVSEEDRRAAAASWLVRMAADPAVERTPDFQGWLAADAANMRDFARARLAWDIAGEVAPEFAADPVAVTPAERLWEGQAKAPVIGMIPARSRWRTGLIWPLGAALAAALLAVAWLDMVRPDLRLALRADHASAPGTRLDLALEDGSRALLDGGSALDFSADAASRRVTLLGGAAWFDVGKEARPFTVRLADTEIRALGTRFSVRDCGNCVEVGLEEGSVEVTGSGRDPIRLTPGQQVRLLPGQPALISEPGASEAPGWRSGRYIFYDVSLREVAGVLARHGAGAIFFGDEALAARKISGSIRLESAGDELRALSEAMGFRIIPLPGGKLLI